MKLNLTVDLLVATATVLLSVLVFVDHCSARLRPITSSAASLSKVGNLAADHLSALQQTSRKVTKSSVVGINWKNVLLLAGLKAGLVGAGLIKKKVAYKKLKGLKGSIEGFDHLNYLNGLGGGGYAFGGGYPEPWSGGNFDGKFAAVSSRFMPQAATPPPYFFDPPPADSINSDWSTIKQQPMPTPRLHQADKYSLESHYAPVIWRKSSLCAGPNNCADYLTSSSITYQLLGPSLPLHMLLPASSALTTAKVSSSPHLQSNQQPYVLTWVNSSPSLVAAGSDADSFHQAGASDNSPAAAAGHSLGSSISQTIGTLRNTLSSLSNSISSNPKIANNKITNNNLNNSNNPPPKQIEQEKEDEKYPPPSEHHAEQNPNHSTQFTPVNASSSQYLQPTDGLDGGAQNSLQLFKDPSETPSEQLVENSNKIWSA